jgi:8-oxo-dGTP pyrophosphatase MutT (NUDIX family)
MSNPFKLISSRKVYENPWISVREDSVIRPGWKEGIFWIVTVKEWSTVIALDNENNIYVTDEYHYAIAEKKVELISGWRDNDESFLECAKRELEEEAGLIAEEWIALWYIDPFSGIITSRNYIFLARNLHKTNEHPDEGELVNISTIPFALALKMVESGEITHWASVVAILKAEKYIHNA